MTAPPVAIGHNNPPPDAMLVREDILARARICAEAADVWAGRETLDAETAPRARDFIAGAKKLAKEAEAARKAEKQPHMDAARAIDAHWSDITARIEKALRPVEAKVEAFLRAEKKRQDEARAAAAARKVEIEAQARAAEAQAAAASSESQRIEAEARAEALQRDAEREAAIVRAASGPVRVESATGLANRMGLRIKRSARIVSLPLAFSHFRNHPEVAALLVRLAEAELRAAPTIDGVKQLPSIPGVEWDEQEGVAA